LLSLEGEVALFPSLFAFLSPFEDKRGKEDNAGIIIV